MYRKTLHSFLGLLSSTVASAQSPDHYPPTVPETIDFNLFNIILYIILPIALVAVYFWYRRSQEKKYQREKKNREQQE